MSVKVKVLLFASAREAAGNTAEVICDIGGPSAKANTSELRKELAQKFPKLAPLVLEETSMTLAVNEEYVPYGSIVELNEGDTVALIPPISGG
mmetsp:Transcript_8588/g.12242  ORF Transcript_8588/g.12242 Transcript_8588/m.12242 type:complete len:93 (-) Transcript_8588:823-1101(-)